MDINGFSQSRYNVLSKLLHSIAKRENIENLKIDIGKGSERGEGYIGEKHLITLRGSKTMELFVKAVPSDEGVRKALDLRLIYLMEILFYKEVMPTFMDFQASKNIPRPFKSVIEFVDASSEMDNELLILKNIKSLGYQLWEKKNQMNADHVKLVYTEYGKYHALSYALKDQQPEVFKNLTSKMILNPFKLFEKMMDGFVTMAKKANDLFDERTEAKYYKVYSAFAEDLPQIMEAMFDLKDKYSVVVHGDCWSNNMMFKYEGSNKKCPTKMCLLDFQLINEGSPVLDLAYFTYASTPKEIYENLDYYLHIYHDTLCKNIRDLGSDPEGLLPFDELKNQWKTHSRFGLMMGIMLLKICVQDQDEVVELSESLEESGGADIMAGFMRDGKNIRLYHERLKSLIVHMVDNKFI